MNRHLHAGAYAAILFIGIYASWIAANRNIWFTVTNDPYSLISVKEGPVTLIHGDERFSKWLLARNYVPTHFDGVLIGPSLSDNVDTRKIESVRMYNLSTNGANITELSKIAEGFIENGKDKVIVICLNQYILKDHGYKTDSFRYSSPLYAGLLSREAQHAARISSEGAAPAIAFHASECGWNDFEREKKKEDIDQWRAEFQHNLESDNISPLNGTLDPIALTELEQLVTKARDAGFHIAAYYYPYNYVAFKGFQKSGFWEQFEAETSRLFTADDLLWSMNTPEYDHIRKDADCYIDGHLSHKGADLVAKDISQKLVRWSRLPDSICRRGNSGDTILR